MSYFDDASLGPMIHGQGAELCKTILIAKTYQRKKTTNSGSKTILPTNKSSRKNPAFLSKPGSTFQRYLFFREHKGNLRFELFMRPSPSAVGSRKACFYRDSAADGF